MSVESDRSQAFKAGQYAAQKYLSQQQNPNSAAAKATAQRLAASAFNAKLKDLGSGGKDPLYVPLSERNVQVYDPMNRLYNPVRIDRAPQSTTQTYGQTYRPVQAPVSNLSPRGPLTTPQQLPAHVQSMNAFDAYIAGLSLPSLQALKVHLLAYRDSLKTQPVSAERNLKIREAEMQISKITWKLPQERPGLGDYDDVSDVTGGGTRPGGPSGPVVVVTRPTPIKDVPDSAKPLIVAYDVAEVLNAPCPWSAATKSKYNTLMSLPYVNPTQMAQLQAQAKKCIVFMPTTPVITKPPVTTWKPPTISATTVTKPTVVRPPVVVKPPVVKPPVVVVPPMTPPTVQTPGWVVKPQFPSVAAPKTPVAVPEASATVKPYTPPAPVVRPPVYVQPVQRPVADLDAVTTIEEIERPKEPKKPAPNGYFSTGLNWWAKKLAPDLATLLSRGISILLEKYKNDLFKKGLDLDFSVSPNIRANADGSLGPQADRKVREAIKLAGTLRLASMGVEMYSRKDFGKWASDFVNNQIEKQSKNMEEKKKIATLVSKLQPMLANLVSEIMRAFFAKYSSGKFGAVADSIDNPNLTPEQRLQNARVILEPFLRGLKKDIAVIPANTVKLVTAVIANKASSVSPVAALLNNEKLRLISQLNQKLSYYNQIRGSDEFSAREELQDIKALQKQIKALDAKIAATPGWSSVTKSEMEAELQKAVSDPALIQFIVQAW